MALLAAIMPSFFKRKRSAEEEQARELRAALAAAPRPSVVNKCLELFAANQALALRVREMEWALAARDDAVEAAMRATVRDELARCVAPYVWTFCAQGDSEPESDEDTGAEAISDSDVSSDSETSSDDSSSSSSSGSESEEEEDDDDEPPAKQRRARAPSASIEED